MWTLKSVIRSSSLVLFAVLLGCGSAQAAVTLGHSMESVRTDTSDPYNFSCIVLQQNVEGVLISAIHNTSSTDHIVGMTVEGLTMARLVTVTDTAGEAGRTDLWFLGVDVPAAPDWNGASGTLAISVDLASATGDDIYFVCMSLQAGSGDTVNLESIDTDSQGGDAANPSLTLQYGGRSAMAFGALYTGLASPPSTTNCSPGACIQVQNHDFGNFGGFVLRQTTAGTADETIGVTASSDDVAYAVCAIAEILTGAGPPPGTRNLLGVGR